jgi:hypothetical protein
MIKTVLALLVFVSFATAESYNFTELRYSDATGRYTQLEGKISFNKDGLNIQYPQSARELEYKNDTLAYLEDKKEVDLDDMQATQMMQYFDVLRLLHSGDDSELKEMFEVAKSSDKTVLKPIGSVKYYIDYIELTKEQNRLKYVKLFLKNSDNISINIDNEIR